jgi:uncharacterized membrane protein YbhN (UPF0104 family)
MVGPAVGVVVAANACFTANGEARIVAITIIAAIVVVFVFVFVFLLSFLPSFDYRDGYEFHLWIPLMESRFGIRLFPYIISKIKSSNEESIH